MFQKLKWRYVTKYSSTDGTGQYVMVRDAAVTLKEEKEKVYGQGNWVFVPRSCLPSTLPENEEESRIPPKPAVTTEGPTGVQTPFATLKGSVNPEGVPTTYYFQYGTTTNWNEYSTPPVEIGSGTSPLSESASISGLAGGTTYYFRIVATSAIGTSAGGPVGFTTQPPPTVTTNAATSVLEEQGTLNATVNGNGLTTRVRFEYGETTTYGLSTSWEEVGSGVSNPSTVVTNLRPDTTYHYCVVASNSAGPSGCGQDLSFKTSAHPGLVAANGTVSAASQDINNALYLTTRNLTTGVWQSALLGEGTGTTYSAPSGVVDSGGNVWVAAEGPGNRLLDGVHATTGAWNPSYESAGGTAYSAPSEVIDSLGNIWLAAEGTKHTLVIAERSHSTGAWETWTAVSGEDVHSAPSAAVGSGGEVWIAFEGPNNLLWDGVESSGHTWTPSTEGTSGAVYSAPSEVVDSSGNVWAVGQGTNRTLVVAERVAKTGAWQSSTLITAEDVYSAPSVVVGTGGELWIAFEGPENHIWDGVRTTSGSWNSSYEGPGAAYSAPSEVIDAGGDIVVGAQGAEGSGNVLDIVVRAASTGEWGTTYDQTVGVAPSNTSLPVLQVSGGQPAVGQPVSGTAGGWSGTPEIAYSYQWNACAGSSCSPISGATASSYTPTAIYVGDSLTVTVTASNGFGHTSATSSKSLPVLRIAASVNSSPSMVAVKEGIAVVTQGTANALFMTSATFPPGVWESALLGEVSAYSPPSAVAGSGGELWTGFEGPEDQLWDGVRATSGVWGTSYESPSWTAYSAPSEAIDSSGNVWLVAEGTKHTLVVAERVAKTGVWSLSTLISAEDVYSAPSVVAGSGGELWIGFEGPEDQLWDGVRATSGVWGTSYESPSWTAYSAPSEAIDSSGNVWLVAEGTKHTLVVAERVAKTGVWSLSTLISAEDVYSAPSAVAGTGGELWISFEGPENQLWDGVRATNGVWDTSHESPSWTDYSAPSEVIDSGGNVWVATQGAGNSLEIIVRQAPTGEWVPAYAGG